jgi:hypothetical protein
MREKIEPLATGNLGEVEPNVVRIYGPGLEINHVADVYGARAQEIAGRVTACVNALAGIPTKNIEAFGHGGIGTTIESILEDGYETKQNGGGDLDATDLKLLLPGEEE